MIINPAFDSTTRTWWVTEPCKCEAPTIRQLKRDLRKLYPSLRFEVPNYYVGDSPRTVWPSEPKPLRDIRIKSPKPPHFGKDKVKFRAAARPRCVIKYEEDDAA